MWHGPSKAERTPSRLVDHTRGRRPTFGLKRAHRIGGLAAEDACTVSRDEAVPPECRLDVRDGPALRTYLK